MTTTLDTHTRDHLRDRTAGIRLTGLTKTFRVPQGPVPAVRGVDLAIAPGETVALLGPNGAGKSTTIDMMLGLLPPGPRRRCRCSAATPARRSAAGAVGAMLQTGQLIRDLSVRELVDDDGVALPGPARRRTRCSSSPGSPTIADRRTQKLSGRPDAARALRRSRWCPTRDLLVLDEPTVAMDVEGRRAFWATMRALRRPRQDGRVRHPLPGGGRRLRRPRSC